MSKEVNNNTFAISSNNESQVPSKNTKYLGSFLMKFHLERFRVG